MKLIERNAFLEKLKNDEPVLFCQLRSRSPLIAEMMARTGLDYVFIEGEHFAYDPETIERCARAIQLGGSVPVVRVPSHELGKLLQVLEAGVMGVVCPHVDTPEQARKLVDMVKYYPVGHRGFSDTSRATKFGTIPVKEYQQMANANVVLFGMIESAEGVANAEAIAASGIDVLVVGLKDLSEDMGYYGDMTPEVQEAVSTAKAAARKAGIPYVNEFTTEEAFRTTMAEGGRIFKCGSDMTILRKELLEAAKRFRELKQEAGFGE